MIFWGEYHNIVNNILEIIKIRLTMVRSSLPRVTLHANEHLNRDRVRVPLNHNTSTKYHSARVMCRVNMRNAELTPRIPGSKHLRRTININRVCDIKGRYKTIPSMKKILCLLE